jgi:hypothetical protein
MVSLIENPGIIRGRDLPGGPTLGALIAETDFEATNAIGVKCVPTNSENRRRLPKRRRRRWQAGRCALDNGHLRTERQDHDGRPRESPGSSGHGPREA